MVCTKLCTATIAHPLLHGDHQKKSYHPIREQLPANNAPVIHHTSILRTSESQIAFLSFCTQPFLSLIYKHLLCWCSCLSNFHLSAHKYTPFHHHLTRYPLFYSLFISILFISRWHSPNSNSSLRHILRLILPLPFITATWCHLWQVHQHLHNTIIIIIIHILIWMLIIRNTCIYSHNSMRNKLDVFSNCNSMPCFSSSKPFIINNVCIIIPYSLFVMHHHLLIIVFYMHSNGLPTTLPNWFTHVAW